MTKAGVEVKLEKSPFVTPVMYAGQEVNYYFSSLKHKEAFEERLESWRDEKYKSLEARFKIFLSIGEQVFDLSLYRHIERRGFYIEIDGRAIRWPGILVFDGQRLDVRG